MNIIIGIVVIAQLITRILAGVAFLFGAIALIVGNKDRGIELLIGGLFWLVVSIVISLIVWVSAATHAHLEETSGIAPNSRYDEVLATLQQIKQGKASTDQKITISKKLVSNAGLPQHETNDLLEQVDLVYKEESHT